MSVGTIESASRSTRVPPLGNGDLLDSTEFLRRYRNMPAHVKAELIDGVVFMASPVSVFHGNPHTDIIGWLYNYRIATPGTDTADNSTIRLDVRNVPQPDVAYYTLASHGGPVQISQDGYVEGSPELVAEISTTSASLDLGPKKTAYARNGIREYIVWRTFDEELDWFSLQEGTYDLLQPESDGVIRSKAFPGLWMDVAAMVTRNANQVNTVLQQGLQSPEHARFVADLQARRTS